MIVTEEAMLIFSYFNKYFNNRELAVALWLIIALIYALLNKSIRKSLVKVIKCALDIKLVILYIILIGYFVGSIFLLYKIGFWEKRLLKDTIIWFVTSGVISCGKAVDKAKDYKYFKDEIKRNIRLVVLLEFISNLYSFSFIVEVILIPIMTVILLMISAINILPEYKNKTSQLLGSILKGIQSLLVLYIFYHSVMELIANINSFVLTDFTKDMALPIILSLMFLLCIYLVCIYCSYEVLFIQLRFKSDERIRLQLYLKTVWFCKANINKINTFFSRSNAITNYIGKKEDINKLVNIYKASERG